MTTKPQVKGPTKGQKRLALRQAWYDEQVKSNKSAINNSDGAWHRPGSTKKP